MVEISIGAILITVGLQALFTTLAVCVSWKNGWKAAKLDSGLMGE